MNKVWIRSQTLFNLNSHSLGKKKKKQQRQCNQHTWLSASKIAVGCYKMRVKRQWHRLPRLQRQEVTKTSRPKHGKLYKTVAMFSTLQPYRIKHEAVHSLPCGEGDQRSAAVQGIACSNNIASGLQSIFFRGLIIRFLWKKLPLDWGLNTYEKQ